jgi:hypothetical protein
MPKKQKHWSKHTPYAVARALAEQHLCTWDRALEFAWITLRPDQPMPSLDQAMSRMQSVQHVPTVPEHVLKTFQRNLMIRRGMPLPPPSAQTD